MQRLRACRFAVLLVAAICIGGMASGPIAGPGGMAAWAQEAVDATLTEENYADWERVATLAEDALIAGRATTQSFEVLRSSLAEWRARFQDEENRDSALIATLERRIEALGPVPEEETAESEEISARRDELNAQYLELVTPVRRAEEAYARAQGLITQIDRLIRERQTRKLLERGPSPLAPVNIGTAIIDLQAAAEIVAHEAASARFGGDDTAALRQNLPTIVALIAVAALLLTYGRRSVSRIVRRLVANRRSGDEVFVTAMILSLGQIILPVAGLLALTTALKLTEIFGPVGVGLLNIVPAIGAAFFAARWIGGQTFPVNDNWPTFLHLDRRQRVRGRFYTTGLGLLTGLALFLLQIRELFVIQAGTVAVLSFPAIVLSAICLDRLGRLIAASGKKATETSDVEGLPEMAAERRFLGQIGRVIGDACRVFAIAGPILAALGYTRAGAFSALSPGLTLGLIAFIAFLQRLSSDLFRLFSSRERQGKGLFAVLVNFLIIFASLPFFAIIWGARWADIDELWTRLNEGFTLGDVSLSPSVLLVLIAAFGVGFLLTRLVQGAVGNSVLPRTSLDPGAQKAVNSGLGYVGIFLSAMVAVSVAGLDLSNLAIVAGALSVGIGFGLQNIVSNFVAGLILLIERPVTEGDWIEVGGVMGTVRRISVRATTIETFDKNDVVVPNSDFVSNQVTNWTRGNLSGRLILPVGVAYGSDSRKVAEILQEIAEEHPLVIVNPPPLVVFQGFGADALEFEMRVILRDINFGLGTRTELNHRIAERFAEAGIEIPFAQRDIWLRNPEALDGRARPAQGFHETAPIRPDPSPEFPTEDDT